MAHKFEDDFREWSKPPTLTEDSRCSNAESVVRNAIKSYPRFDRSNIEIFAQGSYRNGTNISANSDVDVCVRCNDVYFVDIPFGYTNSSLGLVDASYSYAEFKNDVEQALKSYLGAASVSRGNKAFDLHANTYRVDADVVPTFEHRLYFTSNNEFRFISGTELRPDSGGRVVNWPQQNYKNATAKNAATGTRFKKLVRVLKRLRHEMMSEGDTAAKPIPSYLIECLIWNVPNEAFADDHYADNLRLILYHLYLHTQSDQACEKWTEINKLKYLFRVSQQWTRQAVQSFIVAAWNRVGFQ